MATCKCIKCGEIKPTCCDFATVEVYPGDFQSVDGTCRDCCDCPGALQRRRDCDAEAIKTCGGVAQECYWATGVQYASALGWFAESLREEG